MARRSQLTCSGGIKKCEKWRDNDLFSQADCDIRKKGVGYMIMDKGKKIFESQTQEIVSLKIRSIR